MQIPSRVQVGAMTYEVRIIPNMHAERELYGEVLYGQQIIKIAGDISERRQVNTYLHELTHAILFESGSVEDYQDEQLVRRFSNVLTQVVYANKWSIGEETQHATSEHEAV
jgi:Zn-dependent peptidase ImmA (M78 family)